MFGKKHDELDQIVSSIRAEEIPSDALEASAKRVWQRVEAASAAIPTSETAAGCRAIRADLALLRRGQLSPARKLIVEDHLHECASCRAHAAGAQDPVSTAAAWQIQPVRAASRWSMPRYGWAVAAIV